MSEKRRDYGYTLVEIMVTLVIVAILATLASVQYFRMVEKARQAEAIEVLTKIRRGYRILVVDELIDNTYKRSNADLTNGTAWNPDISGADWDWGVLGFEDNPNNNAALDFAYDFLPREIQSSQINPSCTGGQSLPFLPDSNNNLAIARRREGAAYSCTRYIYINCDNGTIGKSSTYQ